LGLLRRRLCLEDPALKDGARLCCLSRREGMGRVGAASGGQKPCPTWVTEPRPQIEATPDGVLPTSESQRRRGLEGYT
jgi:hypothetical protein